MHGNQYLIPQKRDCYIRPFLQTKKKEFHAWCQRNNVPYVNDPTNTDIRFMRNYIRHEIMPHVLKINPGIHKVMAKKIADGINSHGIN